MKARIEKMKKIHWTKLLANTRSEEKNLTVHFSDKMRQQLNDIEDQETFNQIVKEAKERKRIRKELEENARFGMK